MQSHVEQTTNKPRGPRWRSVFSACNRKAHFHVGLYFLFFLWLFAFTGLLLNHPWHFAEFRSNWKVTKFDRPLQIQATANDLERARDVMWQLGIRGEVEWTAARVGSPAFSFRVARPRQIWEITLNPESTRATVEQTDINLGRDESAAHVHWCPGRR